jgi:hypothetical protein
LNRLHEYEITETLAERRTHQRTACGIPVTLHCACGDLPGSTVNESYTGILVQLRDDRMPPIGENCNVVLEVMGEKVQALGEIVRIVQGKRQCAVELKQLGSNGFLLLAVFPPDVL